MRLIIAGPVLLIIVLFAAFNTEAKVCSCQPTSNCSSYAMAVGVHKGKLVRIEEGKSSGTDVLNHYFEVYRTYKGEPAKTVKLTYPKTPCMEPFLLGEDYLIYRDPDEIQRYCNRTAPTSWLTSDLEYLDRMSTSNPLLSVYGILHGVPVEAFDRVVVKLRGGKVEKTVKIDQYGIFRTVLDRRLDYTVGITVPLQVKSAAARDGGLIFPDSIQLNRKQLATTIEYEISFKDNFCDSREIDVDLLP